MAATDLRLLYFLVASWTYSQCTGVSCSPEKAYLNRGLLPTVFSDELLDSLLVTAPHEVGLVHFLDVFYVSFFADMCTGFAVVDLEAEAAV